jgi:hypothetical protein
MVTSVIGILAGGLPVFSVFMYAFLFLAGAVGASFETKQYEFNAEYKGAFAPTLFIFFDINLSLGFGVAQDIHPLAWSWFSICFRWNTLHFHGGSR